MRKKHLIFSILIMPLISGCEPKVGKVNFSMGSYTNDIIEINEAELAGKMLTSSESFFLVTHKGNSCSCYNDFKYILQTFNNNRKSDGKEYLPFFAIDVDLIDQYNLNHYGIDNILSGYVDFYVVVDGSVKDKYTKGAKIDFEFFENINTFTTVISRHIGAEPIKNFSYVTYNYLASNLINKDNNEFALMTIRSGCGDCGYALPHVLIPYAKTHEFKIPLLVVDIEKYREDKILYPEIKSFLKLTEEASPLGYGEGVVPTYQYWKNGELIDAGVYANDSFEYDKATESPVLESCYFDGTRDLKYTNVNLVSALNSKDIELYTYFDYDEDEYFYYLSIEKEAEFHTPLLQSFLSYYCE